MKVLARIIAWISSSIVGLSAILYVMGFLVVHSHLNLLGVSGTTVPAVEYLKEGGRFVLMNLMMFYSDSLIFALLVGVVAISVLIRFVVISKAKGKEKNIALENRPLCRGVYELLLSWMRKATAQCGAWVVAVIILGAIGVSLIKLPSFFIAASINDLIFPTDSLKLESPESMTEKDEAIPLPYNIARQGAGVTETVISEIRSSDETARYSRYQSLLFVFLCVLVLLWFSLFSIKRLDDENSVRSKRVQLILKVALIGAVAIASIELLLLPVNYGKLIVSNEFPVVLVTVDDEELAKKIPPDRFFLMLIKNDEEVVLYDRENPVWESIVMLKQNHVSSIRVVGTDNAL